MNDLAQVLVAVLGLTGVALTVGILQTRRHRAAATGAAFGHTVAGLADPDPVQRLTSAVLLRRFLDPTSEHALRRTLRRRRGDLATPDPRLPYAKDTVLVMSAVLRQERPGVLQKTVADGLALAPTLAGVDLQKANLRNAYLARCDLSQADLYRADLSGGSLRKARLRSTQLRDARLIGTVLTEADLRKANLEGADLSGADLSGADLSGASLIDADLRRANLEDADLTDADLRTANLEGADLSGADLSGADLSGASLIGVRNAPDGLIASLVDGRHTNPNPEGPTAGESSGQASTRSERDRPKVFLSVPSATAPEHFALVQVVQTLVANAGLEVNRFPPEDYARASPLQDIRIEIRRCAGVIVLELPQLSVERGTWRPGTDQERRIEGTWFPTPWNHIEAGVAIGMRLPLLVIRQGVDASLLDLPSDEREVTVLQLRSTSVDLGFADDIRGWCEIVHTHAHGVPKGRRAR